MPKMGTQNSSIYDKKGHSHKQDQQQVSKQKVIQDLNYSQNIFFMAMSSLESLMAASQNQHVNQKEKLFGNYDKFNYNDKRFDELKSQFQVHLKLLRTSIMCFYQENPNETWHLPTNYNEHKALQYVSKAIDTFNSLPDNDSVDLCKGLKIMITGKTDNLHIDNKNHKVNYSEAEKKSFQNNILASGRFASEKMDEEEERIKNSGYTQTSQLQANLNQKSDKYKPKESEKVFIIGLTKDIESLKQGVDLSNFNPDFIAPDWDTAVKNSKIAAKTYGTRFAAALIWVCDGKLEKLEKWSSTY